MDDCRPALAPSRSHHPPLHSALLAIVALAGALGSGCGGDGNGDATPREGEPAYGIVKGCYSVGVGRPARYLSATEAGPYRLHEDPAAADRFYLQAAALGRFLLYDQDRGFAAAGAGGLERRARPDDAAVWIVNELSGGRGDAPRVTLVAGADGRRLVLDEQGTLALVGGEATAPSADGTLGPEAIVELVPRTPSLCAAFPEADVDAALVADAPPPADDDGENVVGYADIHSHIAFPKAMGATVMAGRAFHRFGVEHALADCSALHGSGGSLDILGFQAGSGGHETAGYPDFPYWPDRGTPTHVLTYHRWLERAHLGGLRLLVTHATGDPTLCELTGYLHPKLREGDCSGIATVDLQNRYVRDLEDYVDAQAGGPGLGWLRIVTSPAEARRVIAEGKLAVVLGVEYGLLFDCRVGRVECTPPYVDAQLDRLYDQGVRVVFPVHKFDNAFAGTSLQGGDFGGFINIANKLVTGNLDHVRDIADPRGALLGPIGGNYLEVEECPEGVRGNTDMLDLNAFLEEDLDFIRGPLSSIPAIGFLSDALFFDKLAPLPDYAEVQGKPACATRAMQPLGRYLIERLVDRGMIVEVDHLSYPALLDALDVVEARDYSGVVSSHGWLKSTPEVRDRIFSLGGLITIIPGGAGRFADWAAEAAAEMERHDLPVIGVPIGTDVQGIASQPGPGDDVAISYPFPSADGRALLGRPSTGNRVFDYPSEGVAHYGLYPEWVEELRQASESREDGVDVLSIFMRSAEAYLQLWERAEAGAGAAATDG